MTDERMGEALWAALERLPRGAGVIFRHYSLPIAARRALFAAILRVAKRRRLVLVRAGATPMHGEQGVHGRSVKRTRGLRSWPAHDLREVVAGHRMGADAIFISPVFPTRSHAGQRALGVVRAAHLARAADGRAIALGGLNAATMRKLSGAGFVGWGAIDAWCDESADA